MPPARTPSPRVGADVGLALLVIAVIAMMVVPLPTWLLDVLLATNLSASVAILLVVLYSPDAIAIAAFPTVLLLTTLFRLALNVSSVRLILLQADAGEVIRAFGTFVVRGNYVVGAVVFLILTIIQFVVIAKGSERVAEVGARFALDAMPGKQMAIDAELRAGTIDGSEARRRRRLLARENQFYGAMDGAMKFVKGDVIASVIITIVNIAGGLAIGILQRGLPLEDALRRYGLLTIGDGLVTQIPALILATSAGVLVTRTASEQGETSLGQELGAQLLASSRALAVAGVFVLGLGVVPGFPAVPFLLIGGALLWVARVRGARMAAVELAPFASRTPREKDGGEMSRFLPYVAPWALEVASDLDSSVESSRELHAAIQEVRERLFVELGVVLPQPLIRKNDALPSQHLALLIGDVPTKVVRIGPQREGGELAAHVVTDVFASVRARAADFIGLTETQRLLDELEVVAPVTVRQVVPKPVSLPLLADILRRLVEERVPIRDLRGILEALAVFAPSEKDPMLLAEAIRAHMRRTITFRITQGAAQLPVHLLDPTIEDTIRRAITRTAAGAFLSLPPAQARDVVTAIRRALEEGERPASGTPVVLTQPDIRRFVRKLVESELPDVHIVSFAELMPELALRPVARAHLANLG